MIDANGLTWKRDGKDCLCEDGRLMRIAPEMTDEYLLSIINGTDPGSVHQRLADVVQFHVDACARAMGYDNIITACTYAGDKSLKYAVQAQMLRDCRSDCWTLIEQIEADVLAGQRAMPSNDELLKMLPQPVMS